MIVGRDISPTDWLIAIDIGLSSAAEITRKRRSEWGEEVTTFDFDKFLLKDMTERETATWSKGKLIGPTGLGWLCAIGSHTFLGQESSVCSCLSHQHRLLHVTFPYYQLLSSFVVVDMTITASWTNLFIRYNNSIVLIKALSYLIYVKRNLKSSDGWRSLIRAWVCEWSVSIWISDSNRVSFNQRTLELMATGGINPWNLGLTKGQQSRLCEAKCVGEIYSDRKTIGFQHPMEQLW